MEKFLWFFRICEHKEAIFDESQVWVDMNIQQKLRDVFYVDVFTSCVFMKQLNQQQHEISSLKLRSYNFANLNVNLCCYFDDEDGNEKNEIKN